MSLKFCLNTLLPLVLILSVPFAESKLPEEEEKMLEQLADRDPNKAIEYLVDKLSLTDKTSIRYLDYLEAKASLHTTVYDEIKLLDSIEEGIQLSEKQSDKRYYAAFLSLRAIAERTKGHYDEALSILDEALVIAQEALKGEKEDGLLMGNIFSAIGRTHYYSGSLSEAANAWKKSYNFYDQGGYDKLKMIIVNDLGNLASSMGDFDEAISNFEEVLAFSKANNMQTNLGVVIFNLGLNYAHKENYEKATIYLKRAVEIGKKHKNPLTQAHAFKWLGEIAVQQKNLESAKANYKNSLRFFESVRSLPGVFSVQLRLAETLINMEQFVDAAENIKQAKSILSSVQLPMAKEEISRVEGILYEAQGEYEKALALYKQYHEAFRQAVKDSNQQEIHKIKSKFSSERDKAKTKLLEKELALERVLSEKEAHEKEKTQWLLGVSLSSLIFLAYFFFKQQKLKRRLAQLAMSDELTGANNRRSIFQIANTQFDYSKRYQTNLTIGVCDLDLFKSINDEYGHAVGDLVLQSFAKASMASIRNVDSFGRIGGEEWLFIFPNTNSDEILRIVERINQKLAEANLPLANTPTFSLGVTSVLESDDVITKTITRADDAVYQAKENGRNRVVIL